MFQRIARLWIDGLCKQSKIQRPYYETRQRKATRSQADCHSSRIYTLCLPFTHERDLVAVGETSKSITHIDRMKLSTPGRLDPTPTDRAEGIDCRERNPAPAFNPSSKKSSPHVLSKRLAKDDVKLIWKTLLRLPDRVPYHARQFSFPASSYFCMIATRVSRISRGGVAGGRFCGTAAALAVSRVKLRRAAYQALALRLF